MEKLTEFFDMGGYGVYVWPCYLIAALVMAGMLALSLRSLARARRTLDQLQAGGDEA